MRENAHSTLTIKRCYGGEREGLRATAWRRRALRANMQKGVETPSESVGVSVTETGRAA